MNEAFVTGSRKYGTPTENSDIDLVVLVSAEDASILRSAAKNYEVQEVETKYPLAPTSFPLRFGKMNLIVTTTVDAYNGWLRAKQACEAASPLTREKAIEIHRSLRSLNHV